MYNNNNFSLLNKNKIVNLNNKFNKFNKFKNNNRLERYNKYYRPKKIILPRMPLTDKFKKQFYFKQLATLCELKYTNKNLYKKGTKRLCLNIKNRLQISRKFRRLNKVLNLKSKKIKFPLFLNNKARLRKIYKRAFNKGYLNSLKYNNDVKYANSNKIFNDRNILNKKLLQYVNLLNGNIKRVLTYFNIIKLTKKKYVDSKGNLKRITKIKKVLPSKYLWKSLKNYNYELNYEFNKILDNNKFLNNIDIKKNVKILYKFFKNEFNRKYKNQYYVKYDYNILKFKTYK